jgi:hypothetical protein
LWIYAKGQDGCRAVTVGDAGVEKHFYTVKTKLRERDPSLIENALANIDSQAAVVLGKLLRRERLTADEHDSFGYFVGNMFVRGPVFRRMIRGNVEGPLQTAFKMMAKNRRGFEATWEWFEQHNGERFTPEEREALFRMISEHDIEVVPGPEESLRLLPLAREIGQCISKMGWQILIAPDPGFFLTSDNPVVHLNPAEASEDALDVGFASAAVEVTFPLNRKMLLRARYESGDLKYIKVNAGEVHDLNQRAIRFAFRFVYAPFKSNRVQRWVRDSSHLTPGYQTQISVNQAGTEGTVLLRRTLLGPNQASESGKGSDAEP